MSKLFLMILVILFVLPAVWPVGEVGLGVLGSLSTTSSIAASAVRITTAGSEPINESVHSKFNQDILPRQLPQER